MDTIKNKVNETSEYLSGKTGQATHGAKQEGHEQVAKDSSAPISDRISSGADYVKEGLNKKGDEAKAESNKPL